MSDNLQPLFPPSSHIKITFPIDQHQSKIVLPGYSLLYKTSLCNRYLIKSESKKNGKVKYTSNKKNFYEKSLYIIHNFIFFLLIILLHIYCEKSHICFGSSLQMTYKDIGIRVWLNCWWEHCMFLLKYLGKGTIWKPIIGQYNTVVSRDDVRMVFSSQSHCHWSCCHIDIHYTTVMCP